MGFQDLIFNFMRVRRERTEILTIFAETQPHKKKTVSKCRGARPSLMSYHHGNVPEPVLLIIADISGYTRYMTANAKTLAHSQTIITELVKAIIKQIELPLEVAKLEGDAVFLFCRKQGGARPWAETKQIVGDKLFTFFCMFSERVGELSRSTTCTCNACTHIEKLRLKVVVHSGEALFHRVINFVELAGVDVIIVHRLLKNSVEADQYLLLTESARHDLEFTEPIQLRRSAETYDDIGQINTLIYQPEGQSIIDSATEPSFGSRFSKSWSLFWKLWLSAFASKPRFHHVTSETSRVGKIGFAALMVLLAPIYLPVGILFVLFQALRNPTISHRHDGQHEHRADGSCCNGH